MSGYPILLDLSGRTAVVVGGGAVAEEKVAGLLAAGARVRVIAPALTPGLAARRSRGEIEHLARRFRDGDLAGAWLAIAERDDRELAAEVYREAESRRIPVNVVDDPEHLTFKTPAIVRRGRLTVAISTDGAAPALAVRLRQRLEAILGPEYADFLSLAVRLRPLLARRHPSFGDRREAWYRLVDSEVLDLLRRGDAAAARRRAGEIAGLDLEGVA